MKAYFDPSVLVALVMREPRWLDLADWLASRAPEVVFSDFAWGELVSAIGMKVRRNEVGAEAAGVIIAGLSEELALWTRLQIASPDLVHAAALVQSFDLALRFPDAIHIATAVANECTLITADARQYAAARHFGYLTINPYLPDAP